MLRTNIKDYFKPFASDKYTLYLFGSRIWGNPRETSDVDIAIEADSMREFSEIEERLLDCDCPYNMDIINLNTLNNKELKTRIREDGYQIRYKV